MSTLVLDSGLVPDVSEKYVSYWVAASSSKGPLLAALPSILIVTVVSEMPHSFAFNLLSSLITDVSEGPATLILNIVSSG